MIITHNPSRVKSQRFFVNESMRSLIRELEGETARLFHKTYCDRSLASYHQYIIDRIASLDLSKFEDLIDTTILKAHILDYCDVLYSEVTGIKNHLSFRMLKYSEPLLIDKLDNGEKYYCTVCKKVYYFPDLPNKICSCGSHTYRRYSEISYADRLKTEGY